MARKAATLCGVRITTSKTQMPPFTKAWAKSAAQRASCIVNTGITGVRANIWRSVRAVISGLQGSEPELLNAARPATFQAPIQAEKIVWMWCACVSARSIHAQGFGKLTFSLSAQGDSMGMTVG
jgi:hypothetical protein